MDKRIHSGRKPAQRGKHCDRKEASPPPRAPLAEALPQPKDHHADISAVADPGYNCPPGGEL